MILFSAIFILIASSIYLIVSSAIQIKPRSHLRLMADTKSARYGMDAYSSSKILRPLYLLTRPFSNLAYFKNLKARAEVLKINVDISVLVLLKAIFTVLAALVSMLISPNYTIIGVLVGFFLPDFIVRRKIKAKKEAIVKAFPETMDLLDMCISAGADFLLAINWVIEKSKNNPFVEQLAIVLGEIKVGKTRAEALKSMANRLKIPDISTFTRAIVQSERMGTPIEETFRNLSEDTRNRRFQEGERYAIKASIKILFPLLFCILPAILIVVAGPIIIKFTQGEFIPKGAGF